MKYLLLIAALFLCGCSCNPDKKTEDKPMSPEAEVASVDAGEIVEDLEANDSVEDSDAEPGEPDVAQNDSSEDVLRDSQTAENKKEDSDKPASTHSDRVIKSEKNGVRIEAHYPELGNSEFDDVIRNKVESAARSAQNKLTALRSEETDSLMNIYEYDLSYDVVRSRSDSADVMFTHSEYTGGAHGSTKLEAVMLDSSGKQIDPWSLFDNVDEVLPKMTAEARRQLTERYAHVEGIEEMIKAGTEPTRENFKNMVRTDDGVRIYFEPYTVAPGSEGVLYFDYKL